MMRFDKYISRFTNLSRKTVKKRIRSGRVKINGIIVTDPSEKLNDDDVVTFDNKIVVPYGNVYVLLNKPVGYVCSRNEQEGPTVFSLVNEIYEKELSIAGRLDKDARGIIILTNDGKFLHHCINPKFNVKKEYIVTVREELKIQQLEQLLSGIRLNNEIYRADEIEWKAPHRFRIVLTEGKFHEIKKMVEFLGSETIDIFRVRIGNLDLPKSLNEGEYRELTLQEAKKITPYMG
ncbi:MAG: rRNA pseudouridine synthase [Kosmotoga sp.]|jgi:16S rRNA pseudouridine516 synthase|nr:MAG: rRNA pseudouridine synthase [Kosmotoga sp.]